MIAFSTHFDLHDRAYGSVGLCGDGPADRPFITVSYGCKSIPGYLGRH